MNNIENKILNQVDKLFVTAEVVENEFYDDSYLGVVVSIDKNKFQSHDIQTFMIELLPEEGYDFRLKPKETESDVYSEWLIQIFKD